MAVVESGQVVGESFVDEGRAVEIVHRCVEKSEGCERQRKKDLALMVEEGQEATDQR